MALDLKMSVRREIDRLRKELAAATGGVAVPREAIKRHERIFDMLDGRKTGKRYRRGRSPVGPLERGPRPASSLPEKTPAILAYLYHTPA